MSTYSQDVNWNTEKMPSICQIRHDAECLCELKGLIQGDKSLQSFKTIFEDQVLLSFVKGKKYNVDLAYKTLVNYINVRRYKYPELFKTLLPSTTLSLEHGIIRKLKFRDPHNRVIIVNRTWKWDPTQVKAEDTTKMFCLILDEFMKTECHDSEGVIAIFDMNGFSFQHSKVCTPSQVITLINLLWKNVPIRYKALHIVNEMYLVSLLLKAVRPFLPHKGRNLENYLTVPYKVGQRLFTHSHKLDTLHAEIPVEILPISLGGDLDEDEAFDNDFEQRIRNKEEYYRKFAKKLS